MNGKGSTRRPTQVSADEWRRNWDSVFSRPEYDRWAPARWVTAEEAASLYPPARKGRRAKARAKR